MDETSNMATIHTFLRSGYGDLEDPSKSIIFGKPTRNQNERRWRELHDSLEKYFKKQLMHLLEQDHYDPQNEIYRSIIAYGYIPVLERRMHLFVKNWSNHHNLVYVYLCRNYSKWLNNQESSGSQTNMLKIILRTNVLN